MELKAWIASSSLPFLIACGGTSQAHGQATPSDASPVAQDSPLPQLAGHWVVESIDCLSNDNHLRSNLEIDLNARAFALIGTLNETDSKTCRSALAFQRNSSTFAFNEDSTQEAGVLMYGKEKRECRDKNAPNSNASFTHEIRDLRESEIKYSLSMRVDRAVVRLEGWPECQLLSLIAKKK